MGATLPKGQKTRSTARAQLTQRFVEALARDWELWGPQVLERVREESPEKYCELVAKLVPQEVLLAQTEHAELEAMSPEELRAFMISEVQALYGVKLIESVDSVKECAETSA